MSGEWLANRRSRPLVSSEGNARTLACQPTLAGDEHAASEGWRALGEPPLVALVEIREIVSAESGDSGSISRLPHCRNTSRGSFPVTRRASSSAASAELPRMARQAEPELLCAERLDRIHLGGPAGGQVARDGRHDQQEA